MRIYGYLGASTKEQNAIRASDAHLHFADEMRQEVRAWFVEHESGGKIYGNNI